MQTLTILHSLGDDLRHAVRAIRRVPGLSALVVITLSLGLGANAALFALVDRLFLKPPTGVVAPAELRRLHVESHRTVDRQADVRSELDYREFLALDSAFRPHAASTVFTAPESLALGSGDRPPIVRVSYAAATFFRVVGASPQHGRFFQADEDRLGAGAAVAVVSDAFWRHALRRAGDVVGRRIEIDQRQFTVVGVAAPGFAGVDLDAVDVWLPLATYPRPALGDQPWYRVWGGCWCLEALVRVRGGTDATGDAALAAIGTTVLRRPDSDKPRFRLDTTATLLVGSLLQARGPSSAPDANAAISLRLTGVVALVLLVACLNVANLLLARGLRRRREVAIRLALGISRARLAWQLFVETIVLALVAGGVAVLIAYWTGGVLRGLLFPHAYWGGPVVATRTLIFTFGISLLTASIAGLAPAMMSSRHDPALALKAGAAGAMGTATSRSRLRSALLVVQAAFCVLLLMGAGLFVKSLRLVQRIELGYDVERLVYGTVSFRYRGQPRDAMDRQEADVAVGLAEVADRLRHAPGVERVALGMNGPMAGFADLRLYLPDRDSVPRLGGRPPLIQEVSSDYFAAVGLPLLKGRPYVASAPELGGRRIAPAEMVVNETMARTLWPGEDPIGECMILFAPTERCTVVVGVVADAHLTEIVEKPTMIFYVPTGHPSTIILRASPDAAPRVAEKVRQALRDRFPGAEPPRVVAMADALAPQLRPWRLGAALFGGFGVIALVIAAIGIYGVTAYVVGQRTQEFGLRVALGARRGDLLRLVIADGVRPVFVGVVLGSAASLLAGRVVASLLYATSPHDPWVMLAVAVLLLGAAVLASLGPSIQAARVHPLTAIRAE